jgi:hypothetical protein
MITIGVKINGANVRISAAWIHFIYPTHFSIRSVAAEFHWTQQKTFLLPKQVQCLKLALISPHCRLWRECWY